MNAEPSSSHGLPPAILAQGLAKAYRRGLGPLSRLRAAFLRQPPGEQAFWALRDLSLEVARGEALGVIGRNGAGKSTLLQLLAGTLAPSAGTVAVQGRVAALLELGAGFNGDFTGRENLALNAPLMGLSREELRARMDAIIDFSGIGSFIDQPVKTYSSGMFVRLAFALATSVEPDVLIVDEALSVGDGEFARKSFDRIQALKQRGTTILFCSHSLYQVEAFCDRVAWLHAGRLRAIGPPHAVVRQYELFVAGEQQGEAAAAPVQASATPGHARLRALRVSVDGRSAAPLHAHPGESTLRVEIEFESDPNLPAPTAAVTIDLDNGMALACSIARTEGVVLRRDAQGRGCAAVEFPRLPLRKGVYWVGAYLGAENAVHVYDTVLRATSFSVEDTAPEPGLVRLPHHWTSTAGEPHAG